MISLSVLIPTVPRRLRTFLPTLMTEIDRQLAETGYGAEVEIIALYDNKKVSVGTKRNRLMDMAAGRFLTFLDDDDWIDMDYFGLVVPAIRSNPDAHVIVYDQSCQINGGPGKRCRYGLELEYTDSPHLWTGKPAHTMVWQTAVARKARFPDANFEEDLAWVRIACSHAEVSRQVRIERVLYYYRHDQRTTETR